MASSACSLQLVSRIAHQIEALSITTCFSTRKPPERKLNFYFLCTTLIHQERRSMAVLRRYYVQDTLASCKQPPTVQERDYFGLDFAWIFWTSLGASITFQSPIAPTAVVAQSQRRYFDCTVLLATGWGWISLMEMSNEVTSSHLTYTGLSFVSGQPLQNALRVHLHFCSHHSCCSIDFNVIGSTDDSTPCFCSVDLFYIGMMQPRLLYRLTFSSYLSWCPPSTYQRSFSVMYCVANALMPRL